MAPSALNRENCIFFVHCDAPRVESMTERAEFNSRKFEFEKLSKRLPHTSRWDNNAHIRSTTDVPIYLAGLTTEFYGIIFSSSEGPRPRALRARGSQSLATKHKDLPVRSCPSTLFETQDPAEMAYHVR